MAASGLWNRLNAKPIYREIINAAKKDGLTSAVAFLTHYGFSNGGKIKSENPESTNSHLTLCVEIIDHKNRLETFCRRHGALLKGKTIVYKHVEHWSLSDQKLVEEDGSPSEVIDGEEPAAETAAA